MEQKKKLSIILGSYWGQCQGGAELQSHFIEQEAMRQKWETHYLFLANKDEYENQNGTILHPIIKKKLWNKFGNIKYPYTLNLLKKLNKLKPDVIYQRSGIAFTGIAAYYAKKNNCQFIFHIAQENDVQPWPIPWQKPYLIPEFKLVQYGIKEADIIISQTCYQAQKLAENYRRNSLVIPNGHPVPADCKKVNSKIIILWIGTWKPVKQPEIFVQLAEKFRPIKNVHFIMLGRTEQYYKLVLKARRNNIEVRGEVSNDEVNKYLEKAHVLINTSKHEGFSNTFIQAWMRRVPVVSLNVDPDGVMQKKAMGYCSGSFNKLVRNTGKLIEDNGMRENMGANARKYAVENYSLDNIKKILTLMDYR
ncbi:glycosyltransferase family 4 protein [Desulfobacula toluolica]|uniref:Glycosyltransferase, family I n=1 Tax=Desulfobacula toluolica (strain DSM 7467 / Tol2) TaxID=651182 RepID=K0NNZ5_DESTT|nr:glycosyltransferase family 4 protein [Desulfobacula toluolica]CCK81818.1 glycosyltransferase, family I [Desulfobacula toluolica Tol2]